MPCNTILKQFMQQCLLPGAVTLVVEATLGLKHCCTAGCLQLQAIIVLQAWTRHTQEPVGHWNRYHIYSKNKPKSCYGSRTTLLGCCVTCSSTSRCLLLLAPHFLPDVVCYARVMAQHLAALLSHRVPRVHIKVLIGTELRWVDVY
jgi:hypothetical protein